MPNQPVASEIQARNRRIFGQMIAWLVFKHRRAGMIGTATAFTGRVGGQSARLDRRGDEWELKVKTGSRSLGTAEVMKIVAEGEFFPLTAEVVPDLAEILFKEAVHEAEQSLGHVKLARQTVAGATSDSAEGSIGTWILAEVELDRALRAGIASIVLAIAAGEAQANAWAEELGGWIGEEDRLSVVEKCAALSERVGDPIVLGQGCYQQLEKALKRRNRFVHSRPVAEPLAVTGRGTVLPGSSISLEARATCLAVRTGFIDLAERLGLARPEFLAYCPPGDPKDEEMWQGALFRTGTRSDPDYPAKMERLRRDRPPPEPPST